MRKTDDEDISAFLDQLATEPWLDQARRVWPHYLFHVTDARNVPSIAVAEKLLCRSVAVASGVLRTDSASSEIIAQTSARYRNEVRLYFRPRAPTFYHNEGIRPQGARYKDAHCPMPVVMLFAAKQILGSLDTRFSDGSLASGRAQVGEDVAFLRRMPFHLIYHDRSFHPEEKDEIIFRRQAEVIVPNELSLATLRHVCVRSVAELETLETLLRSEPGMTDQAIKAMLRLVRVNSKALLFYNSISNGRLSSVSIE